MTKISLTIMIISIALAISVLIIRVLFLKLRRTQKISNRLKISRDCVLKLLDKANESLSESVELSVFLKYFTEYALRSFNAQSAAYFSFDNDTHEIQAEAIIGLFPTIISAPKDKLNVIIRSPAKMESYLYKTKFKIGETPFSAAIAQQSAIIFSKSQVNKKIKFKVYDCWGMMIIPIFDQDKICGLLILANKEHKSEFSSEDLELAKGLCEMAGITINHISSFEGIQEKIMIDNQLQTANLIQQHLLPTKAALDDHYESAVYYSPAYRIGGDYYDFIQVDPDHIGIMVADVSGKGIPAGLVMATTRSIATVITRGELSPKKALIKLNNYLLELIPENMFVSVSYTILNVKTGELVYTRAGHEPPICSLEGQVGVLESASRGMVVGMLEEEIFGATLEDEVVKLHRGDMVMLYTDGVTEANNPDGDEFGRERLEHVFNSVKNLDIKIAMKSLVHRIKDFMKGEAPYDDITLVLIKYK